MWILTSNGFEQVFLLPALLITAVTSALFFHIMTEYDVASLSITIPSQWPFQNPLMELYTGRYQLTSAAG
jgi:hypothetical protein